MASTYSTSLRIQLIGTGDQSGVWGTSTNNNLGTLIEQAITGFTSIPLTGTTYTLTSYNGITDEARNAVIEFTGTLGGDCTVTTQPVAKVYIIKNSTNKNILMSVGSGSAATIPSGSTYTVYSTGSNFYAANNYNPSNVQITGGTIDGTTIGGTTPSNGSFYDLTVYDNATFGVSNAAQTVSINTATPAVVTMAVGTTPQNNSRVSFTSTGTLPVGITAGTTYYVKKINSTTFNLSTTSGGTADVNTSSGYTGTISMVVASDVTFGSPIVTLSTNSLQFNGTGAIALPSGNSSQQPGTPINGMIRYNTDNLSFEGYANGAWSSIGATNSTSLGLWQNKQLISVTQNIASGYSATSAGPITLSAPTAPQTTTITIASPGVLTVPTTALTTGTTIILSTTGSLPTGLTAGVTYYVVNPSGLTFQLATTASGTPITTTGSQSGTHTVTPTVFVNIPGGSRWVIL